MNSKPIVAVVVLSAILAGGYYIDRQRAAKESRLSGFFESQPSLAASRSGGRVVRILVREGDSVKAGQPLVQLEDAGQTATYKAQESAVEQAWQQFLEIRSGSRPEEIDKARHAVEQAQANLDKLLNGPRPEEIAAAKAAADVALARLQQAQRGLTAEERASLKAHVDSAMAANDLANKQLARTQSLYDAGAAPRQQLDVAISNQQQSAAQLKDAQETYRRAQEGTPKEELAEARHGYQQALDNLKLIEKGSRPEDVQAGRAALAQAEAAFEEVLRGNRPEDVAKAKAAHEQAVLQAKSAATTVHEHLVTAPADAVVDHVLVADGDVLPTNGPVVQLSYPTDIWLRVYIPEDQLHKVKVGDSADVTVDGISEVLKARVESIATQGEFTPANLQSPEERGRQVFGIRIRLDPPDPRVKAGMYATVKRVGRWP